MIHVFFHKSDLDGHCSGALLKDQFLDANMHGIDYGDEFPWAIIAKEDIVFMVDFSLQPFENMVRLNESCHLVWIDHHKTAIEACEKTGCKIPGLRRIGIGACALVWEHLYNYADLKFPPRFVQLLAEYDVYDKDFFLEEMKDIKGFDGLYAASNCGKIFSYKKQDYLSESISSSGYKCVLLHKNGIQQMCFVHRLIAKAFLPQKTDRDEVNHKDGNKLNNNITNLEWVSRHENQSHALKTGLLKSSSMFYGVSYCKQRLKYTARIMLHNHRYFLGNFEEEVDAARAYDNFIIENNVAAPLNFPKDTISSQIYKTKGASHWESLVLPFQYGLRLRETDPSTDEGMQTWFKLLNDTVGLVFFSKILRDGKTILKYEVQQNKKYTEAMAFECEFDGLKCIAVNKGLTSSQVFDSVWDPEKYDAMLTFCMLSPEKGWTVSLYTDKPDIDVSEVAKRHGGGGHKGAAGFQTKELPFHA